MKHVLLFLIAFTLTPLAALNADEPGITRIWLGHRSHDPGKVVVNWMSKEPGASLVRFGQTADYGKEVRVANDSTIHHVEIPIEESDGVYHYSVQTGNQSSKDATFKAYPSDEMRVAVVADWQSLPDLSAIISDDVHLLLTAGDNISSIHQLCGAGNKECVKPYAQLIDRYPELFRSVPFMPALGNHDKQIRPRESRPPGQPVYDIDATAFRRFFELPGDEWKWHFDVPEFDLRFAALDLHHISDLSTTWQSCHPFVKDSEQFRWYGKLMNESQQKFVVTLYNERNGSMRAQEKGAWHSLFRKGTIAITGFGHFAERAEVDDFTYYNTSLSGKGNQYPDPHSAFLKGADSYILLTLTKNPAKMKVEIKGLDGAVLDQRVHHTQSDQKLPIPVAHRGLLRHAPENTLPAFAACLQLGMGFELDIRTSKDGHLVVIHDENVQRTTDGPARSVRDMTLAELKKLDAGSWFDPAFADIRIPTLEETLALVAEQKRGSTIIALNVKHLTREGEAKLVALAEKYNLLEESFAFDQSVEMSRRLKQLNPAFRIGQNVKRQDIDLRLEEGLVDCFLLLSTPTADEVSRLHHRGKQVLFNYGGSGETRRSHTAWIQTAKAGTDGLLTDYPLECRSVWREAFVEKDQIE